MTHNKPFRDYRCKHGHAPFRCMCAGNRYSDPRITCDHYWCWGKERFNDGARVCYLDVECTQLHANFGYMISWVVKERNTTNLWYGIINKDDIDGAIKRGDVAIDRRILIDLVQLLKNFDFICCHYGAIPKGLDIRFIRTRCLKLKIEFPFFRELYGIDTYPLAKNKLALHSNRLGSIADVLDCPLKKSEVSPDQWILAQHGHKGALKYVLDHNIQDVKILEFVHKKLENYGMASRSSI